MAPKFVERCGSVDPNDGHFCLFEKGHSGPHDGESVTAQTPPAPPPRADQRANRVGKCKACGNVTALSAKKCPACGQPYPTLRGPAAIVSALISLILLCALVWFLMGGGVEQKVANDAIDQYNIAKNHGDKMQICVQAGMVAAAFLQAKDDAKYADWKDIEKSDCENAGMPQQP